MEERVCGTFRGSVSHRAHTFQHTEQAHTCLPTSPDSASEGAPGWRQAPHTKHLPVLPSHPCGSTKGKENKREELASAGPQRKKYKTVCGVGQPHTLRVFKSQRTTCVSLLVLLPPMESLTVSHPPPVSTSLSHMLWNYRPYKLHNKVQSPMLLRLPVSFLPSSIPLSLLPSFPPFFLLPCFPPPSVLNN